MFEASRVPPDDPVLDHVLAAVEVLDGLRRQGDGIVQVQVRPVALVNRVESVVGSLADGEPGSSEGRTARIHLDELDPEFVRTREDNRRA